jgi:hypothetical protein
MDMNDLDKTGQGKAIFEDINRINLNDFDACLKRLGLRVMEARR